MIGRLIVVFFVVVLSGCVQPPQSPMERQARLAMAAEYAAENCSSYLGGYDSVTRMKQDANQSIVTARNLGASDTVFAKAKADVNNAFTTAAVFSNRQAACNDLVSQVAWNAN